MIDAKILLATRAPNDDRHGLVTLVVDLPSYVWIELLTHKRISRNGTSARAQSNSRHTAMGYYMPAVFFQQGEFMQSADEPIENQPKAETIWANVWRYCEQASKDLAELGVAKEQANRVLPMFRMVRGVVTATEAGWRAFLKLRNHPTADKAMQELASRINSEIRYTDWKSSEWHVPMLDGLEPTFENLMIAGARLARISIDRPKTGKTDDELAIKLVADGHLSPFEHIAKWIRYPFISAICCKPTAVSTVGGYAWSDHANGDDDIDSYGHGWESFRVGLEVCGSDKDEWEWWDDYQNN